MTVGKEYTWAGGAHVFALKIAHLRALQQKCDCGPEWLMSRLLSAQWRADDVIYVIRYGLEGGGMSAAEARDTVERYLEDAPRNLKPSALVAGQILVDALYDTEGDVMGERKAGAESQT